jgi:NAD-dependent SIR2 family protein deacetylase
MPASPTAHPRAGDTAAEVVTDPDDAVAALAPRVSAGGVLVVTGAGISTDSGIPDYRHPDGSSRHADPMTIDRFTGPVWERQRYWARAHLGWSRIGEARPNASHRAVAALERAGFVHGVVTQNVDGLHRAAGSERVIDLHGRLDTVVCLSCGERRPRVEVGLRLAALNPGFADAVAAATAGADVHVPERPDGDVDLPDDLVAGFRIVDCRACGGTLKPDVVYFGEHVPRDRFARALAWLDEARTLLVLGSSLVVGSGFRFVTAARRRGAEVVIVNRGWTRGDRHADLKVDASLAHVLVPLACEVAGADAV